MEQELDWVKRLRNDELFIKMLGVTHPRLLRQMRHFLGTISFGFMIQHHNKLKILIEELRKVVPTIGKMYDDRRELVKQISANYAMNEESDKYVCETINEIFSKLTEHERYVLRDLIINDTKLIERNSLIQHITEVWDYKYVIQSYNNGDLTVEDMCKYFFYNEAICSIQTVVIRSYVREIITISDQLDCKDQLDHYRNVFMRKNAPKEALDNDDYLIIDEYYSQSASDNILSYIKNNVIVTCNDIKIYYNDFASEKRLPYKAFIDNLNKLCYDVSYKSTNLPNKGEVPIGSYLKATYLVGNKQSLVYVYYNGTIPDNVRIPKSVRLEQLQE